MFRIALTLCLAFPIVAEHVLPRHRLPEYERRELTIPMRDGTTHFAVALVPKTVTAPLPILLVRTAFSAANAFRTASVPAAYRELAEDGYIFVAEDIRGRFGSEGEFVANRMQNDPRSPKGINESTDAYDVIDWLVKHVAGNNGRVGVMGTSYSGWLAGLAGVGLHPAVKAISPQAPTTDTWLGDDFFHQGAFRQSQGLIFAALMEIDKTKFTFLPIPDDEYAFYLGFPNVESLGRAMKVDRLPSWVSYLTHPARDAFWQAKAMQNVLVKPAVPMLFVGGWWDQEDILGPELAYRTVERADTGHINHLVLGPWYHNGWLEPGGDSLGPIRLGSNTADWFRNDVQRPWFAFWLHGKGDGRFPEARVFETGANAWRTFDTWPPKEAIARQLYLQSSGHLSFDAPNDNDAPNDDSAPYDSYVSDPANPVPYVPRNSSDWQTWLEQDQRFLAGRTDVRSWRSDLLTDDLTIAGDVIAHLFASTTGTDADWVVKLIDVYPDTMPERPSMAGYELMVNADIMRGRYWRSFSTPTPIPANTVTPFAVDMHQQLYRFRKGHRLMVQVQSSWFPLYDRNPQTFVANIFRAKAGDFRVREHRVWHTSRYPSHVTLPVLPAQTR